MLRLDQVRASELAIVASQQRILAKG